MGVQDPGGGIPLGNYYELLEGQIEPKRKMGKNIKRLAIGNESSEEEIFLVMEAINSNRDLNKVNPFLV